MISEIKIVPTALPDGLYPLPDGRFLIIKNGLGIRISPCPADTLSVVKTLLEMTQKINKNIIYNKKIQFLKIQPNGAITYNYDDNNIISAGFTYLLKDKPSFSISTVSFQLVGTDPATEAYSLLVKYEDGSTQSIPPMPYELGLLEKELEKYFGKNSFTYDRETGIFVFKNSGGKLKADYNVSLLADEEKFYYNNHDEYGVAWQIVDYGEGESIKLKMITEKIYQIFYYTQ